MVKSYGNVLFTYFLEWENVPQLLGKKTLKGWCNIEGVMHLVHEIQSRPYAMLKITAIVS